MFRHAILLAFLSGLSLFSYAQKIDDQNLVGEWVGNYSHTNDLIIDVAIRLKEKNSIFTLSKQKNIFITKEFTPNTTFNLTLDTDLSFRGEITRDTSVINGFMELKGNLYPIKLNASGNLYTGKVNLAISHYLKPTNLRLSIREVNENGYTIYPLLGTFWVNDFKHEKNTISFEDYVTGLQFKGECKPTEIAFTISLAGNFITKALFKKVDKDKAPALLTPDQPLEINDGWKSSDIPLLLSQMETDIETDTLVGVESVLVAKNGNITYEKYFAGFDANTPHDTRSASKSVSSAIIGIAIDDKIIENINEKLYAYIPKEYQYTKDSLKSKITLQHLLTMSSGLDVNNKAYEGYYQDESEDSWLQTVLEAPMVHEPGTYTDYGSANPFLLGVYLQNRLDMPLEFYIEKKLFGPLGITNYIMNTDDTHITPYFGGGLRLTPRDMLKFGQLYLNKGEWKGVQLISKNWIEESTKVHTRLQDFRNKDEYGYFWYNHTYTIGKKSVRSIEARGAGGQFIFIVPELEVVAVITAGNYRNGKTNQSLEMFREYVLPALLR